MTSTHTINNIQSRHLSSTIIISVQDVQVQYQDEKALLDISFDVRSGERLAIIGPNGAGKSTLIQAIMGLIQIQAGTIHVIGEQKNHLGYVPQHQHVRWDFPVTVQDVVMMGMTRQIGWFRFPTQLHWQKVKAALQRVGLSEYAKRQISELSGGQQQRVFIARALAQNAEVLLLDEPFAGVDVGAQSQLLEVLDTLNQTGITIILTTHDLSLAFNHFDRVIALRQRIVANGKPDEVYTPDTLSALYGGKLATFDDGQSVTVIVDDHNCEGC